MLQMLCAGVEASTREKRRDDEVWRENEARFEKSRNAASARALPDEEQRARFLEIDADFNQPTDGFVRLDRAFEMLGLRPQAELAVYRVLTASKTRPPAACPSR